MKIKDRLKKISIIKVAILTALLGAMGGQGHKQYRRIYIPLFITILAFLYIGFNYWTLVFIMLMILPFSIGYGIPCPSDEDPSAFGSFWYRISHQNDLLANILTRGTIGLMVSLSLIPIPIIKRNWLLYTIASLLIIITYSNFAWRDLGVLKMGEKHLLWSDLIVYGIIGLGAGLTIYF